MNSLVGSLNIPSNFLASALTIRAPLYNPKMPSKITISEVKVSNSQITLETVPQTTVFIGCTAGIGKATVTRLIAQRIPIKVYIVGRNAAKHQNWIGQLREINDKADVIFLEAEMSLMSEVKRICTDIKAKESSIDAVYLSTGYIPYNGRESPFEFHTHMQIFSPVTDSMQRQAKGLT